MNKYQKQKENARQAAQAWQSDFNNCCYSWQDLAEFLTYFERLARRYGLIKEFTENGIL